MERCCPAAKSVGTRLSPASPALIGMLVLDTEPGQRPSEVARLISSFGLSGVQFLSAK